VPRLRLFFHSPRSRGFTRAQTGFWSSHALDELAGTIGLLPMQRGVRFQALSLKLVPLYSALELHHCFVVVLNWRSRLFSHSKSAHWVVIISALKIKLLNYSQASLK
jgi:hypothetical protein